MRRLALFALLLPTPVLAQDTKFETVTVYGRSLVGVWHGTLGQSGFRRGLFGNLTRMTPAKLGQLTLVYCRIAPVKNELEMFCHQLFLAGLEPTQPRRRRGCPCRAASGRA
jgi:hypothetical protein